MTVRQVPVRNTETGATAAIPETALQHFAGWEPIDPTSTVEPDPPADTTADAPRTDKKKEASRRV